MADEGRAPERAELLARIEAESRGHYAVWTLFNQALADHLGLHPTDLQCLGVLDEQDGPLCTGEIARLTGLTPGSATRLVDRLVKAGLAERHTDPTDRRRALVSLAPGSLATVRAAWDEPSRAFGEVLAGYTDDQLAVIGDYLRRASEVGRAQAERLRGEAAGRA
ncbi:MarR family transcriptional regulator [Streptomyces mobaraensis NBRC 13819 = DSM 40847]|uniref:MarR family transcriptional regulator n=2 Tax=Streptomyces mobaraensis TaxID=35621 RepID=A0A5N5W6U7_STRMB|nr:MarR family transcriptional regulator [Streptomyces mobaraensis]EME98389.1 transcriptional regulator [Streptomyces mobaraensis NBRC 13819 = DSM 40847]KAB7843619.1 MarR family transcriptional regulator [Streptomyces mobaraensis]QTT76244.1 MarR family transcriptional regulator [Streptomyces mobaraensis NBRC 13819 = DSM 40847]